MCDCLQLTIETELQPEQILQSNIVGQYNGQNYYYYNYNGYDIYIWVDATLSRWFASSTLGGGTTYFNVTFSSPQVDCPIAVLGTSSTDWFDNLGFNFTKTFTTALCPDPPPIVTGKQLVGS